MGNGTENFVGQSAAGPERLQEIAASLRNGQKPEPLPVRTLLSWFGVQRRGSSINESIRRSLAEAKLATVPAFEGTYIDGVIEFVLAGETQPKTDQQASSNGSPTNADYLPADPTYRIGKLRSANVAPVSVKPQQSIREAITIMMARDFSQLPVMEGEREVKGVISWATIGSRLALGTPCPEVRNCMERPHIISADASLFEAIHEIVTSQYVLVRDSTSKISGIVTTSDLSLQFRQLAEPFLLLGEIENHIRRIIERGNFSLQELGAVRDPADGRRSVSRAADLSFGEYIRLLENESRWSQLQLQIDRRTFIDELNNVRRIRNDVMHFDPDGISDDDLHALRNFTAFLQRLQSVLS